MRYSTIAKLVLLSLFALLARPEVRADIVTITFSAQAAGGGVGDSSGSDLSVGSLVQFGTFSMAPSDVLVNSMDVGLLETAFDLLAEARIGYFGGETILDAGGTPSFYDAGTNFGAAGAFAHEVTFEPDLLGNEGERLYMWIYDAPTAAGATEYGIFSDSEWTIPSSLTMNLDMTTLDPSDALDVYIGDRGPETSATVGGSLNKLVGVPPIPEPSVSALLGLAACLLICRRQRD